MNSDLLTDRQILNHAGYLYNVFIQASGNVSMPSWEALISTQSPVNAKIVYAWTQVAKASLQPDR